MDKNKKFASNGFAFSGTLMFIAGILMVVSGHVAIGAVPVIVLTKADLCDDLEQKQAEVSAVALGVDVLITTALKKDGYNEILPYIAMGKTIAFIGSSGVGKSTLISCLIGEQRLDTNGLRNDDKGRHTTTHRELILLPNGGMVVDTLGM